MAGFQEDVHSSLLITCWDRCRSVVEGIIADRMKEGYKQWE